MRTYRPHIYFVAGRWEWTARGGSRRWPPQNAFSRADTFVKELNEKRAMQYFTKG